MRKTPLKRTGFRKLTYEEALAKKKAGTPIKRHKVPQDTRKPLKVTPKRRKEKTTAKLKKELDAVFSKYIRAKYPKWCYTCGKRDVPLQCGHYISRQFLVTRWDENNCRPQCWGCNGYGKGQPLIFEENLKKEFGNDFVEKMKASRHQILKLDRHWYEEQIALYEDKLKECGKI